MIKEQIKELLNNHVSVQLKAHMKLLAVRNAMKLFYVFPVNRNKIFFTSYEGKQYSCNPKYIYKVMKEKLPDLRYVYEYNHPEQLPEDLKKKCIVVKHNSFRYFYEMLTSKVVITNSGTSAKIPIRRSQTVLDTRHGGGAYKRVGKDIPAEMNGSDDFYITLAENQTTYMLSSSARFSDVTIRSNGVRSDKFLNYGMPRNDLFFWTPERKERLIAQVKQRLGLGIDEKIVLYAPTYRGNAGSDSGMPGEALDVDQLLEALTERFSGKWCCLYRGHYFNQNAGMSQTKMKNVSSYPDMQELLLAADVLITDYSSTVWDYSFSGNPGFLYVPDRYVYERSRGLYTSIDSWPFLNAENMEELCEIIRSFDEDEQKKRNENHHFSYGSYEHGTATERVIHLIMELIST